MRAAALLVTILLAPEGAQTVRVEMTEFAFRPAEVRVAAGRPVRVVLVNRGQIAHQFELAMLQRLPATVTTDTLRVEAPGLDLVRLQPGAAATIEFRPRSRGRYGFACTIEGHREGGMLGVLDVR